MADNANVLADQLSANLFYVENRQAKSLRSTFADTSARAAIAASTHSDESSLTVSRKLFPKGYDEELKAANAAKAAEQKHFGASTIFADFQGIAQDGSGKGGKRRFLTAQKVTQGAFFGENVALIADAKRAGELFALALPNLIQRIGNDGVLGSAFDQDKYPHPDDIVQAYTFQPAQETLEPVPSGKDIPVTGEALRAAQKSYEARLETRYKYGMQRASKELASTVGNVATRLAELIEWNNTDPALRKEKLGRTKAPQITETLFPNVAEAVQRLRQFALPDTDEGSQLIQLLDDIDRGMAPERMRPDTIRSNSRVTEQVAANASTLVSALEELDFFD